jgi:hypothetical protein
MWIFTETGFISAVRKNEEFQVRARDSKSLESLARFTGLAIIKTPLADYPYRIVINQQLFCDWISQQAMNINYSNFKSQIAVVRGYEFAKPLNEVWSVMHDVEDSEARVR